jgi:hypothetical protein
MPDNKRRALAPEESFSGLLPALLSFFAASSAVPHAASHRVGFSATCNSRFAYLCVCVVYLYKRGRSLAGRAFDLPQIGNSEIERQ